MKIHQVKTKLANSYVADHGTELVVFDVAKNCHSAMLSFITQTLGRCISDISLVCATHDDPDHIGGVSQLAALADARMIFPWASNRSALKFRRDPAGSLMRVRTAMIEGTRRRAWDMYFSKSRKQRYENASEEKYEPSDKIPEHTRLKNRETLPGQAEWVLIHTPGHSWDSVCYFHAATGSLITGDTILASKPKGELILPSIYSNRKQLESSLELLSKLEITNVLPGHGTEMRTTSDSILKLALKIS
ncbi:MAG: glyoxylase-like metal-dependent hydrolase (beta-lactamase superfamily II) [Candidatus Azotimanducaceae bacterium]|jgi:glyoxylase-like metal-dependent hydrolase (beta-lactamase superfamily II)